MFTGSGSLISTLSGCSSIASSVAGELQIAYIAPSPVMGAAAQGMDLKILASFSADRLYFKLVARPDIKRPEELRGMRVGVTNIGSGLWMDTMLALEQMGLNPQRIISKFSRSVTRRPCRWRWRLEPLMELF